MLKWVGYCPAYVPWFIACPYCILSDCCFYEFRITELITVMVFKCSNFTFLIGVEFPLRLEARAWHGSSHTKVDARAHNHRLQSPYLAADRLRGPRALHLFLPNESRGAPPRACRARKQRRRRSHANVRARRYRHTAAAESHAGGSGPLKGPSTSTCMCS